MFTVFGSRHRYCDGISRRNFLQVGALGVGGADSAAAQTMQQPNTVGGSGTYGGTPAGTPQGMTGSTGGTMGTSASNAGDGNVGPGIGSGTRPGVGPPTNGLDSNPYAEASPQTRKALGQGHRASQSASTPHGKAKSGSTLDRSDRKFIEEAAKGGMAEVEMGQLASERAQSPDVKQFGQRMVQDHSKANDELKQLASSKGVDVPAQTDKSHQKKMEKLQKLSGAQFDKQYMDDMVKDHKKDVKEFQKEAKSAKDPDVKSFAAKTTPTLQEHLQMAEAAQKAAKGEKKASK